MKALLVALVLLAGCAGHAHTTVGGSSSQGGLHAHIEGGRGLAALLGLSILAAGIVESERSGYAEETRDPPPMADDRRVSEQDCTKPIDYTLGNIRCK